eukprot:7572908-Heterocapsa_arctica.AAC.1
MASDISEKEPMDRQHGMRSSDVNREEDRDKESSQSKASITVCEDIIWNMPMIVHADEIGHATCIPTDLIECKRGK